MRDVNTTSSLQLSVTQDGVEFNKTTDIPAIAFPGGNIQLDNTTGTGG